MRYEDVCFPLTAAWSTPFARWQGTAAETNSLVLAERAARAGLERAGAEWPVEQLVLGQTVPQAESFYGPPTLAARLGFENVSGPWVAQACATSVTCLHVAAAAQAGRPQSAQLVITTDRVSNSPQLTWPAPSRPGGAPEQEHWALDNFARDPWGGEAMVSTAEHVAREAGFTKRQLDILTALRYEQYAASLDHDRAFQKRFMVGVDVGTKRRPLSLDEDTGVRPTTLEDLKSLPPVDPGGVTSYGTQTHPADGSAGLVMTGVRAARERTDAPLVQVLASGFARVERARMPKAPVPAARAALDDVGIDFADLEAIKTHNPFAVNDLWFARETGVAPEDINAYGCSLVYGHPQGPTGLRAIIELAHILAERGGGVGLFTGCAAGDTGAAIVIKVDD